MTTDHIALLQRTSLEPVGLSRRNLLIGLAASATAATAADAATAPRENPELLAMADALPAVRSEYVAARDNVRAIVAEWSPHWPVPSGEIIRYGEGCKVYRGIDGKGIELPWGKGGLMRVPELGTPERFAASADHHAAEAARRATTRSKRGMKFHLRWAASERACIEPARAFWAEVDRITAASGIEAAQARLANSRNALRAIVDQIMGADDWTIAGAVIKAQALSAWREVDEPYRMLNVQGPAWAEALAASVVRHAS